MLHDIVHQMEPSERFQYVQLLGYLASVDNSISKPEMAFFEQRLGSNTAFSRAKRTTQKENEFKPQS